MKEIKCPHDLNQFLLGEPIFENRVNIALIAEQR